MTKLIVTRADPTPGTEVTVLNSRLLFVFERDKLEGLKAFAIQTLAVYLKALLDNRGLLRSDLGVRHQFVVDCEAFAEILELAELRQAFEQLEAFRTKFENHLNGVCNSTRDFYLALIADLRELPGQPVVASKVTRTAKLYQDARELGFTLIPTVSPDGEMATELVLLRKLEACSSFVAEALPRLSPASAQYRETQDLMRFINRVAFTDVNRALAVSASIASYSLRPTP